jgi:pyruvate dehydrogenase E2 component (dihydrolipoamide acetyltransferase)
MTEGITAITMPQWGLTMTEGTVVGWLKKQGEPFAAGDEILEIETPKITNVLEAPAGGTLRRIVAAAGATLPVGALLAVVAPAETSEAEIDSFVGNYAVVEPQGDGQAAQTALGPRELDVAGRRIRVLEAGEGGVPLVFIHGFGADLGTWMFNQPRLAQRRRTVALDLPGHGGSTKTVGTGDRETMTAVIAESLEALGIDRAHLVGHSLGGAIAASLAIRQPASAASLTLIAPAGFGPEINQAFIDGFVRAARRKEVADLLALLVHDPALVSRRMIEDVLRYKRLDDVPEALAAISGAWFAGSRQSVDLAAGIADLATPLQVICGARDRILPPSHAQRFAPRGPIHILADSGHIPHMEQANEVTRLIQQFIEGA